MTRCQRCQEPGSFSLPVPGEQGAGRCWQPFFPLTRSGPARRTQAATELLCSWPEERVFSPGQVQLHRACRGGGVWGVQANPSAAIVKRTAPPGQNICLANIIVQPLSNEENAFELKRLISSAYRPDLWDKVITTRPWCRAAAKSFGNTFRECWREEGPPKPPVKHQHGTGRVQIFSCCVVIYLGGPDVWDGDTAFRWCLKYTYISYLESSTKPANQRSNLLNIFKLTRQLQHFGMVAAWIVFQLMTMWWIDSHIISNLCSLHQDFGQFLAAEESRN